ncbi:dethiobiotin synthase [Mucilaginibacter paludis]|uniref:ATP-dependent dethiobiotin synthetase BioD n=1 Tax=Mucilaginibacter paludis DSM 18603 TaxID=714943 RepID=H1Y9J9_9SPHI|nr:dethiobiotin synthase [Mucilaginibacter paludis]EHQ30501.1 Dethiobiotin synthetase [Mucilaginibacter paludis DSM 18603]
MSKQPLFITGIGTGIGKTIISAILVEKLKADYWKPIQSGDLDNSDTLMVRGLVSNNTSVFHPEAYRLTQPYSPHKSAELDGITINPAKIILPETENQLIIEGAGGLMVPLNDEFLMIDLIKQLGAQVILVSQNYLGSINHTLLSVELLKSRSIPVKGIVFNGETDIHSQKLILEYSKLSLLGNVSTVSTINAETIQQLTNQLSIQ